MMLYRPVFSVVPKCLKYRRRPEPQTGATMFHDTGESTVSLQTLNTG